MARALKGAQASDPAGGSDGLLKFEGLVVASASSRKARIADGGSTELSDDPAPLRGGNRGREEVAGSFVPYRDWREGAAGSRKLKAASSRGSAGRSEAPLA